MSSIFTRIVKNEIPCYKIAEDDNYLAFLDINPLVKGHTLVIPKKEIDYIFDVDDTILANMMLFAKKVAKALDKAITCKRTAVVVLGLDVPHAHIHLIPMNSASDINFANPKLKLSKDEFQAIASAVASQIQ
jgi:histidine triad (HIT) family protein